MANTNPTAQNEELIDSLKHQNIKDAIIALIPPSTGGSGGFPEVGGKYQADKPIEMTNAQVIPPTDAERTSSKDLLQMGIFFTQMDDNARVTMSDKGQVTDVIQDIVETGVYEGNNVANAPEQGPVMVMAFKDSLNNFGYFCMGNDQVLWTGGRPSGGSQIGWKKYALDSEMGAEILPSGNVAIKGPQAIIGDDTDIAKLILNAAKDHDAVVEFNEDGAKAAEIKSEHGKLIIQSLNSDVEVVVPQGAMFTCVDGDGNWHNMLRSTIQLDITNYAQPSRAECITAFKQLPEYTNESDFANDAQFYIKDTSGSKLVLVKYRAGTATNEATAGTFFYEVLNVAA